MGSSCHAEWRESLSAVLASLQCDLGRAVFDNREHASQRGPPVRMTHSSDLARLQVENARLVALLERHGIEWQHEAATAPAAPVLTTASKVTIFRRLFHGRSDVFPLRWESQAGKSGYAPACSNEWRPGVCEKPRIKCADCGHRSLIPVSDRVVFDHLAGKHTMGVYPLLADDNCWFVAVDFDDADW